MRSRVAEILALPISAVSIKATTTERLGFTGRGEGIAAQAVANYPNGALNHERINLLPDDLVDKAREVVDANRAAGRRVAVAESCTGGLVSAALTEIPGSSEVFEAGYVTYSNAAKMAGLNVCLDVVETFGAVSVATAWAMAQGALEASGADVAVAITGIAGPDGGTRQKPVGTVVFARAERDGRTRQDRRRPEVVRRQGRAVGNPPSGGALRARTADAVKLPRRAFRTRRSCASARGRTSAPARLSNIRDLKAKSTEKWTLVPPLRRGLEAPLILEIFERPLDIVDADMCRAAPWSRGW